MKIKLERLPKSRVRLEVEVSALAMGEFYARALSELGRTLSLPGFRPGAVPMPVVREKIGSDRLTRAVLEYALPHTYLQAIRTHELTPIEGPRVEVLEVGERQPLRYRAEVDVLPKVTLPSLSGVRPKKVKRKPVTDEDLTSALERLRRLNATLVPVRRAAKLGDHLEIDFESFVDGSPVPHGSSKHHPALLGSKVFVAGFEEKLVGMKALEEREFDLTFPADFHQESLRGKRVHFKVKVRDVAERILPKLDDAFAKKVGANDLADLRTRLRSELEAQAAERHREAERSALFEEILGRIAIELPESLVHREIARLIDQLARTLTTQGVRLEQFLEKTKKKAEDLVREFRPQAERNVKATLLLDTIRREQKIEVTPEEIAHERERLSKGGVPIPAPSDEQLKNTLALEKAFNWLIEKVKKA